MRLKIAKAHVESIFLHTVEVPERSTRQPIVAHMIQNNCAYNKITSNWQVDWHPEELHPSNTTAQAYHKPNYTIKSLSGMISRLEIIIILVSSRQSNFKPDIVIST